MRRKKTRKLQRGTREFISPRLEVVISQGAFSRDETPITDFFTRNDFVSLCRERNITILREVILNRQRIVPPILPNFRVTEVCCLITKGDTAV